MNFTFFTFGGSQLWEDVFFYQKWRIQRHYRSKKYRLLDDWDIQRASGGFEDCRKAFVKFIETYEIPRQKGELIILLHGLGETKKIFRPLWQRLIKEGYNVAAINYPSTKKPLKSIIKQLEFFLNHCEDVTKVSFVTKGISCLILRKLISSTYGWQEKFRLNKVININPANNGSDWLELLSRLKIFNYTFGPLLKEMTPRYAKSVSMLPPEVKLGLIFCDTWINLTTKPILEKFKGVIFKSERLEKDFSDKFIQINNHKLNIFNNPKTIEACLNFLSKGDFK